MSHFTEYQAFQYSRIFQRFASANGELTVDDLALALPLFGPERDIEDVEELFHSHDSRECGSLNFDDFLTVLADLLRESDRVNRESIQAFEHLAKRLGKAAEGLTRDDLAAILRAGDDGLSEVEVNELLDDFFPRHVGSLSSKALVESSNEKSSLAWVTHKPPPVLLEDTLTRTISVHLFSAKGLFPFAKVKQVKRKLRYVHYQSLNPYVSVSCLGVAQNSTVLINQLEPEWDQELTIQITLPTTKFSVLQEVCRSEYLTFSLYDHDISGVSSQQLWLGSATLPLSSVLRSVRAPTLHVLTLRSPDSRPAGCDPIRLEVSIKVNEGEISEHIQSRSVVWGMKYGDKIHNDLNQLAAGYTSKTKSTANLAGDGGGKMPLWEQMLDYTSFGSFYTTFFSGVSSEFPRRNYQLVGVSDSQTFYPLSCFITPLYSSLSTMRDIAMCVARIPGRFPNVPFRVPAKQSDHVSQPYLTIFNGYGSELDHSVLLCDLFLGMGLDAFVVLGRATGTHSDGSCQSWVLTRAKKGEAVAMTEELTRGSRQSSYNLVPSREEGGNSSKSADEYEVVFWDPSTGQPFELNDENMPFLRADTLINGKNVYCNVQRVNLVKGMEWDIEFSAHWRKFITPKARDLFVPSLNPCFPRYPIPEGVDPKLPEDTAAFVTGLVSAIQLYRRDTLYLPVTKFASDVCRVLQEALPVHEARLNDPRGEGEKEYEASITEYERKVDALLPARSYWHSRCLHFDTNNIASLIVQLAFTGMLDCSVPNVIYTLAADFDLYPLGTKSVWIHIGYIVDLAAES